MLSHLCVRPIAIGYRDRHARDGTVFAARLALAVLAERRTPAVLAAVLPAAMLANGRTAAVFTMRPPPAQGRLGTRLPSAVFTHSTTERTAAWAAWGQMRGLVQVQGWCVCARAPGVWMCGGSWMGG
jgi:hypothetical protein